MTTMKETESVKIEKDVLNKVRKYCKINGLKLTWFISRGMEDCLNRTMPATTGMNESSYPKTTG